MIQRLFQHPSLSLSHPPTKLLSCACRAQRSQIQRRCKDNVALDLCDGGGKAVLEVRVANALGGRDELAQQLLQAAHRSNDAACEYAQTHTQVRTDTAEKC